MKDLKHIQNKTDFNILIKNDTIQSISIPVHRTVQGDQKPTYDNVSSLTYLDMVLSESMRVYPPIPLHIGERCSRDFPRASPSGNPSEQPCQPLENPAHASSFTWINPVPL